MNKFLEEKLEIIKTGMEEKPPKKGDRVPKHDYWAPIIYLLEDNLDKSQVKKDIFTVLFANGFFENECDTIEKLMKYNPAINRYRNIMRAIRAIFYIKGKIYKYEESKEDIKIELEKADIYNKFDWLIEYITTFDPKLQDCLVVSRVRRITIDHEDEVFTENSSNNESKFPGGYTLTTDPELKEMYIEMYFNNSEALRRVYNKYIENE